MSREESLYKSMDRYCKKNKASDEILEKNSKEKKSIEINIFFLIDSDSTNNFVFFFLQYIENFERKLFSN